MFSIQYKALAILLTIKFAICGAIQKNRLSPRHWYAITSGAPAIHSTAAPKRKMLEARLVQKEPILINTAQAKWQTSRHSAAGKAMTFKGSLMIFSRILIFASVINSLVKMSALGLPFPSSSESVIGVPISNRSQNWSSLHRGFSDYLKINSSLMISSARAAMLFIIPTQVI